MSMNYCSLYLSVHCLRVMLYKSFLCTYDLKHRHCQEYIFVDQPPKHRVYDRHSKVSQNICHVEISPDFMAVVPRQSAGSLTWPHQACTGTHLIDMGPTSPIHTYQSHPRGWETLQYNPQHLLLVPYDTSATISHVFRVVSANI